MAASLNPRSDAWGGAWGSASAWGGAWGWSFASRDADQPNYAIDCPLRRVMARTPLRNVTAGFGDRNVTAGFGHRVTRSLGSETRVST